MKLRHLNHSSPHASLTPLIFTETHIRAPSTQLYIPVLIYPALFLSLSSPALLATRLLHCDVCDRYRELRKRKCGVKYGGVHNGQGGSKYAWYYARVKVEWEMNIWSLNKILLGSFFERNGVSLSSLSLISNGSSLGSLSFSSFLWSFLPLSIATLCSLSSNSLFKSLLETSEEVFWPGCLE
jgi:hypothetical protein